MDFPFALSIYSRSRISEGSVVFYVFSKGSQDLRFRRGLVSSLHRGGATICVLYIVPIFGWYSDHFLCVFEGPVFQRVRVRAGSCGYGLGIPTFGIYGDLYRCPARFLVVGVRVVSPFSPGISPTSFLRYATRYDYHHYDSRRSFLRDSIES